eukprot:TRINITY_DN8126_c0_g1_i1.p1 TRINITY_DN8126_c0_g1~~TRINITY_DN8126_c0_g1_i1.p1  ORF type:complete len:535 (+),score=134.32 TRINITY_DN8126_c0_g1_i1:29-1633(+)
MYDPSRTPVLVLNTNTKRENGRDAQFGNIRAGKAVADIVRTCLGPRAMSKMILSQSGSIVLTADGNAILRELNVAHPSAKNIIELSRTQDEEVGDGTTSVVILAGEVLSVAEPFLLKHMHPRIIIRGFTKALEDGLEYLKTLSVPIDLDDDATLKQLIETCIGTKFVKRWKDLMSDLSLQTIRLIADYEDDRTVIDLKRYVEIQKVPGDDISDSQVIPGVVMNKDVVHSAMRRRIENPRVILLDVGLEISKGTGNVNIQDPEEWEKTMKLEEENVKRICMDIIKLKPDLVITEKGISDEAQHFFVKHGVTALRRLRKTINDRIARATGATIVNRPEELQESDVGTRCSLFTVEKIGDEYYSFLRCEESKSCCILLRGPSKEVLNEVERNLNDSLHVTRNIFLDARLCPGGGSTEMALGTYLREKSLTVGGVDQWPYHSVGIALEVIPRTLIENCGVNVVRTLTNLRATHNDKKNKSFGINGETGEITDMTTLNIWEPLSVKVQTFKAAIESACTLLRIDDIVSGQKKKEEQMDL